MAVEPNRWGIIYNPKAGSRKTQKRWNEIRSYMENRKVVFDYVPVSYTHLTLPTT